MRLPRLALAQSLWPRTGGGPAQAGRFAAEGPVRGRVVAELPLPLGPKPERAAGGLALSDDGDLRVVHGGRLLRIGAGRVIWRVALVGPGVTPRGRRVAPPVAPLALAGGVTLAISAPKALLVDARGKVLRRLEVGGSVDDSGPAPNLSADGRLVLTRMTGEVELWGPRGRTELGAFGYDVVAPARYPDGSFAVAGYAGKGLVRVGEDGAVRWRADLADPDLLSALDDREVLAAGSLNAKASAFYDPRGRRLGRLPRAAVFASLGGGAWAALSKGALARVSSRGRVAWERRLRPELNLRWGACAPLVDARGWIYAPSAAGLLALDPKGRLRFRAALGAQPAALCPTGEGLLAALLPGRLVLLD